MPRIAGVDIPEEKPIEISLTYIHGIGRATARKILSVARIDPHLKAKNLGEDQHAAIRHFIENELEVEGDARRKVSSNIRLKMDIGCYQGLRHRKGLPVHGQRTHTNARTRKGRVRVAIAGKKKAPTAK